MNDEYTTNQHDVPTDVEVVTPDDVDVSPFQDVIDAIHENTRVQQETQQMIVEGLAMLGGAAEELQNLFQPKDGKPLNVGSMLTSVLFGK